MNDILEKILYIVLGTIAGIVVGYIILSIPMVSFVYGNDIAFTSLTGIFGVLLTIIIIFYNRNQLSKRADIMRNENIALITHEMRTALTSTSWSINFILKNYGEVIKEADKKMLEDIIGSIHTTVMHTVDLLDTSLLDIGKLKISLEWVSMDKVEVMIREVIEKYTIGTQKEGIALISKIELDGKNQIEVDTLRLRIVLENLLENSMQYIGEGKKEIRVEVTNSPTNLNLKISDTGIGIPSNEQSKIFGEFYRASNARKKLSSGSGIGLHMCAQYVKAHHGTIRFESKEGEGTTFFITIPLKTSVDTKEFLNSI